MNHRQHIITLCFLLLPLLALGQLRHWEADGLEVFFWDQFDTVFHGSDPFFERVAPPEEVSQMMAPIGQDAAGFIWMASRKEHILRFDGHRFERFSTPKPADNRYHFIDDATNSIWLNTDHGLCCFDMSNGQWQLYPNPVSPADSLFSTVFFDPFRQLLLCSSRSNGVFEFDLGAQAFSAKMQPSLLDENGQYLDSSKIMITQFQACDDGSYWATFIASSRYFLASWLPQKADWEAHPRPFIAPTTGLPATDWPSTYSLYVDEKENCTWAGGANGLLRYDWKTKDWQQFMLNDPLHQFTSNNLYDIIPWGERHLALTTHNGLHFFDKQTLRFYNHQFFPTTLGSHWSHITHHPLLDKDGRIWLLAGVTGLFRLDPLKQLFSRPKYLPPHFSPHKHYLDSATQTALLLGYDYQSNLPGCRIDHRTGKATQFMLPFCQGGFLPEPEARRIWLTTQGAGCNDTGGSIWQFDLVTNKHRQLHQPVVGLPPGITTDSLDECRISKATDGNIWFSSMRFGLVVFEAQTGMFRSILPKGKKGRTPVAMLVASRAGKLWYVQADSNHVMRLDPATGDLDSFPLPPKVKKPWYTSSNQMAETADGKVWVPIGQRLYMLDPAQPGGQFSEVPSMRPSVNVLATDEQGNLWCNTERGLSTYNCRLGKWKTLTSRDGMPESPYDEPVSNCHDDKMYLTGAASFQPSKFRFNNAPATPVFTGLRVLEQQRDEGRFLAVTRRVNLRPGEDALTIEFAATNYTNPEDNQFAYRLVGQADEWVEVGNRHSATFTNLEPGDYRFELRAANSDGFWNPKAEALDIRLEPHFYQTLWFKALAAALALAAIFLLYKNRLRAAQRESLLAQKDAELRQQQAEFQQQVAELENAALRSQMNPHFIFNVLNSIHYFLDTNDARSASDYLAKFSRLVRLVLDHSSQKSVTLHNDLSALLLYLEMEALRFKGKLTYTLDVAPDIDQKYLRVPPLLIQPYVENAIWHGLMHKHDGGNVRIHIAQPDENLLRVTVEDDGIGRAAASALKSKSAVANKSKGMEMTAKRLALLGSTGHKTTEIQIEDLTDADGQPCGTRVVIEIPV